NIRETNRGTKGVKLVDLAKGDKLIAISRVVAMQEGADDDPEDSPVDTEPNQDLLEDSDSDESIATDENLSDTDLVAEEEADLPPLDSEERGSDDES
ncbi:MAG: hypothetical protein HOH25_02450, partial [Opitutae bacterium]|nr:hypothetical protein [Opitutae bacterium]